MNTFKELRKLARDKRDRAIKAVRSDYQQSLAEINSLEKLLIEPKPSLRGRPKPAVPMRVEIMEAVPKDSTFTAHEVLKWLELDESEFTRIRTTIYRMIKLGEVKRIRHLCRIDLRTDPVGSVLRAKFFSTNCAVPVSEKKKHQNQNRIHR